MLIASVILVRGWVGLCSALSLPASSTGCSCGDRQYVTLFQLSSKGGKQSGSPTSVSCSLVTLNLRGQAGGPQSPSPHVVRHGVGAWCALSRWKACGCLSYGWFWSVWWPCGDARHLRLFFLILEIFADLTQEPGSDVCFEVWLLGPGRALEPSGVTALLSPLFPSEEVPGWQGRCAEFARPFTLAKVLRVTGNGLLKILLPGESSPRLVS